MKKEAEEWVNKNKPVQDDWEDSDIIQAIIDTSEPREKRIEELELKIKHITQHLEPQVMTALFEQVEEEVKQEQRIKELEAQIEKLTDFVLSKTECCDVCPIVDTCINSEGVCPYAGILAKGKEEVTRKWLMQFISKEIKEND